MSVTTRSLLTTRRPPHDAPVMAGVAASSALLFISGLAGHPDAPLPLSLLSIAAGLFALGVGAWRTWRRQLLGEWTEGALAAVAVTTSFIAVGAWSAPGDEWRAGLYLVLAAIVSFTSRRAGAAAVGLALILEIMPWVMGAEGSLVSHVQRGALFILFGALAHLVHGARWIDQKRHHAQAQQQERANMLREARQFRLIHSGRVWEATAASRERAETMIMTDAVEAVHHTTYVSLRLLKTSLSCHTCVLLWCDDRQGLLHIKELVSDSDSLHEAPIETARGAIGGVTRRREPVRLKDLKPGYRGLPYYREANGVRHFLGVPVLEHGHLRGVLCVDRVEDTPFDTKDVEVLEEAAAYIVRAVQNERLFVTIEQSKYELGRFFEASRRLNGVITPEDVWREALVSIGEIAAFDLAAFTIFDEDEDLHTITRVEVSPSMGEGAKAWAGDAFGTNSGWVSMVVKNRHYLPYGGHVRDGRPLVFGEEHVVEKIASMVVLPLISQDRVLGTLVIGHREAGRLGSERREMLEVVANQIAISLQNANLYANMERMATRDALTGLANRRTFLSRLEEAVARHKRSGAHFRRRPE